MPQPAIVSACSLAASNHAVRSVCAHCVVLDTPANRLGELVGRLETSSTRPAFSASQPLMSSMVHGARLGVDVTADVFGGYWRRIRAMGDGPGLMRVVCEGGLNPAVGLVRWRVARPGRRDRRGRWNGPAW